MTDSDVSLRDQFAMAALPALIQTAAKDEASGDMTESGASIVEVARVNGWESDAVLHDGGAPFTLAGFLAMECYSIADALMRERTRPVFPMAPIGGECIPGETLGRVPTHDVPDVPQSIPQSGAIPDGVTDGSETITKGGRKCGRVLHVYVRNVETPTEPMTCDDSGIVNDTRSGCQSGIDTPIQGV